VRVSARAITNALISFSSRLALALTLNFFNQRERAHSSLSEPAVFIKNNIACGNILSEYNIRFNITFLGRLAPELNFSKMKLQKVKLLLKGIFCLFSLSLLISSISFSATVKSIKIYYDNSEPSISFAAEDLKKILDEKGIGTTLNNLNDLPEKTRGRQIIISNNGQLVIERIMAAGGLAIKPMGEQD
jgi:hypothetical protein